jgi:ATP-dependent DNA helicase HFM1/MER3
MKPSERVCLREFNKSPFIKFPIKDTISTTAHKISLMIQVQLGGIEHPTDKDFMVIRRQFLVDKSIIFERIQRLIRCVIDCKSADCDAVATRHALDLARSLSAEYWESSNLQLRQVPNLGPVANRKFASNNVSSVEKLASLDTASIERIMGKNPPYGKKIQDSLIGFPRLTLVSGFVERTMLKVGQKPEVSVKAILGFKNPKVPVWAGRRPSLTFMAETSDGTLVHFWRGGIQKLDKGFEVKFTVELSSSEDEIKCYLTCEEIVGTICSSVLKPKLPASAFPAPKPAKKLEPTTQTKKKNETVGEGDEFGGDGIEDDEMLAAVKGIEVPASDYGSDSFADIDDFNKELVAVDLKKSQVIEVSESIQMENGKWTCNHHCHGGQLLKNGRPCKHKCCHEGLDKPRKVKRKVNLCGDMVRFPYH